MVAGMFHCFVVGDLLDGAPQDLARAGFGQSLDDSGGFEGGNRSDAVADHLHHLFDNLLMVTVDAGVEHHETDRDLALQFVIDTQHGALGHIRMIGQDLLHGPGGEAMTGHIDDVVGTGHDKGVSVFVDVAGVGGFIIPGELFQVGFDVSLIVLPQRGQCSRRQRQLDDQRADFTGFDRLFWPPGRAPADSNPAPAWWESPL
jgi:hypothetical protein